VTVTVWPKQLHDVCEKHNILVLKQAARDMTEIL
jgi:hypothetical protein